MKDEFQKVTKSKTNSKENQKQMRKNKLLMVSLIIVLIATLTPGNGKIAGDFFDKIAHFLIFFFFSINLCFKYQKSEKLTGAMFFGIILGLATEVIQQFIPGRNMDIYDGIADSLGIIIGYYVYRSKSIEVDKFLLQLGA